MSPRKHSAADRRRHPYAPLFAALGHEARLALIAKLCLGEPLSISELTQGTRLTRQAITKHLRVLETAGVVHSLRSGRESLFEFNSQSMEEMKKYLETVSKQWDQALARLRAFVED